ncbi:hypothetical protein [Streptomyces sp. Da 82-17]|uniref:hypothetical protein n=1 Tax=Streptomyces sp. Da 82-17 TaxID=3377116 RepID=UPI0038D49D6C
MPLHFTTAPAPALRSVLAALGSPTAVREARTPALCSATGPVRPELALPVHVLSRTAPAGGPPRTRHTGWRFLLRTGSDDTRGRNGDRNGDRTADHNGVRTVAAPGDRTVAAADTRLTPDGWTFSHFLEGPYVTSAESAVRQAEALPAAYQPRLLSVPELYMLTLWLHGDPAADPGAGPLRPTDLLVPLAPAPPGIAAHLPHRAADLLPVLTHRIKPAPPLLGSPA